MLEHVSDVLCSSQLVCGFRLLHGLSWSRWMPRSLVCMTITTSSRNPWTWALSRYCYQLSNAAPASQNRFTISQLLLTSWGYVHTMKVIKGAFSLGSDLFWSFSRFLCVLTTGVCIFFYTQRYCVSLCTWVLAHVCTGGLSSIQLGSIKLSNPLVCCSPLIFIFNMKEGLVAVKLM